MAYHDVTNVVTVGDSGCGRTAILYRAKHSEFNPGLHSTIGVEFGDYSESNLPTLRIWDTAGQERYRDIIKSYYKNKPAFVIAFDCTNQKSFENVDSWHKHIQDGCNLFTSATTTTLPIILLITKADEIRKRVIPLTAALQTANRFNLAVVCETSAKEDINVQELLISLRFMLYSAEYNPQILYAYSAEKPGLRRGYQRDEHLTEITEHLSPHLDFAKDKIANFHSSAAPSWPAPVQLLVTPTLEPERSPTVLERWKRWVSSPAKPIPRPVTKAHFQPQASSGSINSSENLCELCFENPLDQCPSTCGHHYACAICKVNKKIQHCPVCQAQKHQQHGL